MRKRLIQWILVNSSVGAVVFLLAGTWRDPWLQAYVLVLAVSTLYPLMSIDEDLARERFHPPSVGADGVSLRFVRLLAFAHMAAGALDSGRWHLTAPIPAPVRAIALAGMALSFWLFVRAMVENRFFSSVVRVQTDRGHRVVGTGPYAIVRHPGYAGMILGIPLSGLVLGSWLSVALALVYSGLLLRRVVFEDAFLRSNLDGYSTYTQRVTSRLIPGVW
jgi:protein-S-isoprenylcysteine O-methyltransferase Ste14